MGQSLLRRCHGNVTTDGDLLPCLTSDHPDDGSAESVNKSCVY